MLAKATCLVTLFVWCSATPAVCSDNDAPPYVAIVTADRVNLRAGPHTNYEVLGQINSSAEVVVRESQYSWSAIDIPPTSQSFVHDSLVLRQGNVGLISAERVNVRARASLSASVIAQLGVGNRVIIIDHDGEWYRIAPPSTARGWVVSEYLEYLHPWSLSRQIDTVAVSHRGAAHKLPTLLGHDTPPRTSNPNHMAVEVPLLQPHTIRPLFETTSTIAETPASISPQPLAVLSVEEEPADSAPMRSEISLASTPEQTQATTESDKLNSESAHGIVVDLGRVKNSRGASHKLKSLNGDVLYWIRCDEVDLNTLIYHRVTVMGELHSDRSDPQVLIVHSIETQPTATPSIEVGDRPLTTLPSSS